MQFLLMVYENLEHFATIPDAAKRRVSDACDTWFEQLQRAGQGVELNRLHAPSTAATLRKSGQGVVVTDGPFAETKEVFGGYVIVECRDRAEALEVAKGFPVLEIGLAVEVRPVMTSAEDQLRWQPR
ncbi:MAG TPA: YciI family protein [Opitutaceae bacterium]